MDAAQIVNEGARRRAEGMLCMPRRFARPHRRGQSGQGGAKKSLITGNLALDLDSRTGLTISGGLTAWTDVNAFSSNKGIVFSKGGAGANATITANDPLYGQQPSIVFPTGGGTDYASVTNFVLAQPYTAYSVCMFPANTETLLISNTTLANLEWPSISASTLWRFYLGSSFISGGSATLNVAQAHALVANGASSSMYVDASGTSVASGNGGTNALGSILQISLSNAFTGSIARLLFYSGAHTTVQISQMFRYFGSVYGGAWS